MYLEGGGAFAEKNVWGKGYRTEKNVIGGLRAEKVVVQRKIFPLSLIFLERKNYSRFCGKINFHSPGKFISKCTKNLFKKTEKLAPEIFPSHFIRPQLPDALFVLKRQNNRHICIKARKGQILLSNLTIYKFLYD